MKATFEIKEATDGKFVFNLRSANDQVILTSQKYESKESAKAGIASVKQNAPIAGRYAEKSGIASVKKNAPAAETVDLCARVRSAGGGSGAPLS